MALESHSSNTNIRCVPPTLVRRVGCPPVEPVELVLQPSAHLSNSFSSHLPTCRTRCPSIYPPVELVLQPSAHLSYPFSSHLPTCRTRSPAICPPVVPVLQPSAHLSYPLSIHLPTWGSRYPTVCLVSHAPVHLSSRLAAAGHLSLCTGRAGMKVAVMALSMFFLNVARAKEKHHLQQQPQQQQHEEDKVEEVKRRVMGPKKPPQTLSRGWGDGLEWVQTYEQALFLCQKIGKPLMVIHHLDECPYSQALKKAFAASDEIQTMAEDNFIMLNVMHETVDKNLSPDGTYVPRIIFIDPSLTVRADITSRYKNRLYTYEPEDIPLLIENMKTAKQLLKSEL
uniref:Uncharacterized protein n=2 Tax=Eptatretus burgeri TaxID=7764 RepID=A0A8C4NDU4_EPTBU